MDCLAGGLALNPQPATLNLRTRPRVHLSRPVEQQRRSGQWQLRPDHCVVQRRQRLGTGWQHADQPGDRREQRVIHCRLRFRRKLSRRGPLAGDWHTIDGGGGTSTGGVDSVIGGFWTLPVAVQTTNAPVITIVPAGAGQATISWTPNTPGFVLQETLSLSPTNLGQLAERLNQSHCRAGDAAHEVLSPVQTLIILRRERV